jgi:predicted transcriptional regulator
MPAGNITTKDRLKRLAEIRNMVDEGMTDYQIANAIGMPIQTVKRNRTYLEDLAKSDLTSEEVANKRAELYTELTEAMVEAREMFDKFKLEKPSIARNYFISWMETINYRMRLYGLDNVKSDTYLTQINNNFGQNEVERVPADIAKKIRTTMIQNHEDKLKADG